MQKIKLLTLILGIAVFYSCTTSKLLTSNVKAYEVKDMLRFEPLSYIYLIEKGNRGVHHDSLSSASAKLITSVLGTFKGRLPYTESISMNDAYTNLKLEKEIEHLCLTSDQQRSISGLKLTPTLDSLLEVNQKRFGLIIVATGFTRIRGNYGAQVAKGIGLGILTLGMVYSSPIKSNSTVYAMIVDSHNNNITFFRRSLLSDKDPFDADVLSKQIYDIFEGYFWVTIK